MSRDGWKAHPLGGTQAFPLTSWKTATALQGRAGVMQIEYAKDPKLEKRDSLQLLITGPQARALSQTYANLADLLEKKAAERDADPDASKPS